MAEGSDKGAMDDDHLRHICKLASIMAGSVRDPEWVDYMRECSPSELRDQHTGLQILAKAFVELARRADMLPTFRVPAERRALAAHPMEAEG